MWPLVSGVYITCNIGTLGSIQHVSLFLPPSPLSLPSLPLQNPTRNTFTQTEYTMFRLEYDSDSNFPSPITVTDMASITTYTTPANLNKGTVYHFRVAIRNSAGISDYSDIMSGRTAIDREYTHSSRQPNVSCVWLLW